MDKLIGHRLNMEKRHIFVMFLLIGIAIIFFVFKNITMAYFILATWLVLVIYSIIYAEKTEDVIYNFSR